MEIKNKIDNTKVNKSLTDYDPDKRLERMNDSLDGNTEKSEAKTLETSDYDLDNRLEKTGYNLDGNTEKTEIKTSETTDYDPDKRLERSDYNQDERFQQPEADTSKKSDNGKDNGIEDVKSVSLENKDINIDIKDVKSDKDFTEREKIENLKEDYIDDVIVHSDFPQTIDKEKEMAEHYEKSSPQETQEKRAEFNKSKGQLRAEWEKINGEPWPTYTKDVYDSNGTLIREKGSRYDAHHIKPLGLGGTNTAENLTPLSADIHTDHMGVHALGSPYDKLVKELGA